MTFSPDGGSMVTETRQQLVPAAPNRVMNVYLVGPGGAVSWVSQGNGGSVASPQPAYYDGSTPDLSSVVFNSAGSLVAAAQGYAGDPSFLGGGGGYLYDRTGGHTYLVDVDNSGNVIGTEGATLGSEGASNSQENATSGNSFNAVSSDGSKIFFEVPGDPALGGATGLYMRKDNQTTTLISQPAPGVSSTPQNATFVGASSDGSKAFFVTSQQLTADDQNSSPDIYEYGTVTGQLTRVTAGTASDPGLLGVSAISNDGSHVYFVATGQLVAGQGVAGQPNMYVYDTVTGTLAFIATLAQDAKENFPPAWAATTDTVSGSNPFGAYQGAMAQGAQTTPDGMHFIFASFTSLTGYDNTPPVPQDCYNDGSSQQAAPCLEIYEYSAASGQLVCVSCGAQGSAPLSPAVLDDGTDGIEFGANALEFEPFGIPTNISSSGERVVFETSDPFGQLPGGALETQLPFDVYEWEAAGTGGCPASSTKGCQYLLSPSQTSNGTTYGGMTPSGNDVFLLTKDSLLSGESNSDLMTLYDARVGGGFAGPVTPVDCQGQDCRSAASPPSLSTAGSVTFTGPGNVKPGRLRGRVRVSRVVHGSTFRLRVTVPGSGRVAITGFAVRTVHRSVGRAGTYILRVRLTTRAGRLLARRHRLRLRLRVSYAAAGAGAQAATVRLTVAPAHRSHARRARAGRVRLAMVKR